MTTEKKYLKWYNKIGYGSGDIAGNVVYAFLSSFVMLFLTDSIGLNAGIIGTLMMVSKIFDGVSDIFFGTMIDKTKSKMGKARPWMLWAYIGCAVMLVAIFLIPESWGEFAKYAYFFITYTLLNAVFFTANNIAYGTLTALITKNGSERVQMGSIRFVFAFGTSLLIQTVTIGAVTALGGDTSAWKMIAIIYAIIGLVVNTISVFSVKELPAEELEDEKSDIQQTEKYTLKESAKLLIANKYYLIICGVYILTQIYTATMGMGVYYMKYILGDANLLGTFSWAINVPMMIGLFLTPVLVSKLNGMFKINVTGYAISTVCRIMVLVAGYMGNLPLMLIFTALASFGMSPLQGDLNALIAACSDYTYKTKHKRIDGTMFSCTSLGVKIGGGIGTALCGWLLAAGGYVENAVVQSASCIGMLNFMYLWFPILLCGLITFLLSKLKVEQANKELSTDK